MADSLFSWLVVAVIAVAILFIFGGGSLSGFLGGVFSGDGGNPSSTFLGAHFGVGFVNIDNDTETQLNFFPHSATANLCPDCAGLPDSLGLEDLPGFSPSIPELVEDGLYRVSLVVSWAANSNGNRTQFIDTGPSGGPFSRISDFTCLPPVGTFTCSSSVVLNQTAGSVFEFSVYQDSGGDLGVNGGSVQQTAYTITRLGDI